MYHIVTIHGASGIHREIYMLFDDVFDLTYNILDFAYSIIGKQKTPLKIQKSEATKQLSFFHCSKAGPTI